MSDESEIRERSETAPRCRGWPQESGDHVPGYEERLLNLLPATDLYLCRNRYECPRDEQARIGRLYEQLAPIFASAYQAHRDVATLLTTLESSRAGEAAALEQTGLQYAAGWDAGHKSTWEEIAEQRDEDERTVETLLAAIETLQSGESAALERIAELEDGLRRLWAELLEWQWPAAGAAWRARLRTLGLAPEEVDRG